MFNVPLQQALSNVNLAITVIGGRYGDIAAYNLCTIDRMPDSANILTKRVTRYLEGLNGTVENVAWNDTTLTLEVYLHTSAFTVGMYTNHQNHEHVVDYICQGLVETIMHHKMVYPRSDKYWRTLLGISDTGAALVFTNINMLRSQQAVALAGKADHWLLLSEMAIDPALVHDHFVNCCPTKLTRQVAYLHGNKLHPDDVVHGLALNDLNRILRDQGGHAVTVSADGFTLSY